MDFSLLKFPGRDLEKFKSLQQLRERLLSFLLHGAFVLATVLYLISLVPVYQKGLSIPPLVYSALYIWLAWVTFGRRVPYLVRAGSWAIFFYLLGVTNLALSGLNVDSGVFFLTYILMAGLFFELKQGFVALGISAGTIALFGYSVVQGQMQLGLALPQTAPLLWIIGGMIVVMAGVLLILPLSVLMRGLVGYLEIAREEAEDLKNANQALRLSEERYRSLVEISPDLITLIGLDGKVILTNKPGLVLFGYDESDMLGNDHLMFVAPEDRPLIAEAFQKTLESGSARDVVCQCVRKDGRLFDAEFSSSLVRNDEGEPEAVIAVGRDITARRIAERVLQEAREELETRVMERTAELRSAKDRLTHLLTHSPTVMYASSLEEGLPTTYVSDNVCNLMGYSAEQLNTDPHLFHGCMHPQDVNIPSDNLDQILETGNGVMEYRVRHQNGEYRWVRDRVQLVRSPDGQPLELVGSCIDITAQKQAEESYQTLVDSSVQGTAVFQEGRIVYGNQEIADSFGIPLEELKTLTVDQIMKFLHPDDRPYIWSKYQDHLTGNSDIENFEIRLQQLSGEIRHLVVSSVPITYTGKPALQITAFDITERKRMEQALRESEETARVILNATQESLFLLDANETLLAANEITAERLGRALDDLLGVSLRDLFPEEIARVRSAWVATVVETGEQVSYEDANNDRIFDVDLFPVFDDHGQVTRVVVSARDVTEQKKMEQALRESEEIARVILNATPASMVMVSAEGICIGANRITAERLGMEEEAILGKTVYQLFPHDLSVSRKAQVDHVFKSGRPGKFEDVREGIWFENYVHPVLNESKQVTSVVVSSLDITERKNMEQALRESEETARVILNATPASMTMISAEGVCIGANRITAERLGMEEEAILGKTADQLFPHDLSVSRKAQVFHVFKSGRPGKFEDVREGIWFENYVHPVLNESKQVTSVVVSSLDITERKKMEQALRENEETLRIMMNTTPSSLSMVDPEGRLLGLNRVTAERLGVGVEQAQGQIVYQYFPDELARSRKEHIDGVFRTGKQIQFEDFREGHWFENHVYPILNENGQVVRVVISALDLTERMRIEQTLRGAKEELEARVAERTRELSESREQLRALTTDVVTAQEQERRKISRELHDEAGQALVSMKYGLESILADLPKKELPIRNRLTSAIRQLDQTMEQIRSLAHSLRPPLLDIADLDLTLRDYCHEFGESTKLQVDYTGDPVPSLTDQAELAFFRFLQEALTNVVKHANATRVQVRLKKRGVRLSLLVADNGIGYQAATNQGQGHLGMQERFRMLDGQVRIRSACGVGFVIAASVPTQKVLRNDPQDA